MKKSYNGNIEVARWLLTFMVAIMHLFANNFDSSGIFEGWYIAVDFFFVISGLFLAASFEKKKQHPVLYTLRRWGGMFWIYETSLLLSVIIHGKFQPAKMGGWLIKCVPDFFGIQMSGFFRPHLNEILWYISALLLSGLFLLYIICYIKNKSLRNGLLIVLIFVGYAYIWKHAGNLDAILQLSGIGVPLGVIRGIAGMSIGILIFSFAERIHLEVREKIWLSLAEIIAIAMLVYNVISSPHSNFDFYSLLAIAVIVFVMWKQSCVWSGWINMLGNWLVNVFGKNMTLAMYTYSGLVYVILREVIPFSEENQILITGIYNVLLVAVGFTVSKLAGYMDKKYRIEIKGEWLNDSEI